MIRKAAKSRWAIIFLMVVGMFTCGGMAQDQEVEDQPPEPQIPAPIAEMQKPVYVPATPTLVGGTPVWLRLADEVKVKKAHVGERVAFVLYRDLYYRNWLLAKAGTPVDAHIDTINKAKVLNRGSKVVILFEGLKLLNGQMLPLTGESTAEGGTGFGGQVAGGLLDVAGHCNGWPCLLFDIPALPTALVLGVATKGETRDVKVNASAPAFVDGDFVIDVSALSQLGQPSDATGKVTVVAFDLGLITTFLYCNGTPLAHLRSKHKMELELKPGYYRFATRAKRPALEVFVNPNSQTNLLAGVTEVRVLNEHDQMTGDWPFFVPTTHIKNGEQLLKKSKPLNRKEVFETHCDPLLEETKP
jgi:hypothetical protein